VAKAVEMGTQIFFVFERIFFLGLGWLLLLAQPARIASHKAEALR